MRRLLWHVVTNNQVHFCFREALSLMYLRAMEAPIMVRVMATSSAKGKSSGRRSKVFDGCTRVRYRSSPRASAKQVDSRFAGALSMPAQHARPPWSTICRSVTGIVCASSQS